MPTVFDFKVRHVLVFCIIFFVIPAGSSQAGEANRAPGHSLTLDLKIPDGRIMTFVIENGESAVFYDAAADSLVALSVIELNPEQESANLLVSEVEEVIADLRGNRRIAYRPLPGGTHIYAVLGEVFALPTASYYLVELSSISLRTSRDVPTPSGTNNSFAKAKNPLQEFIFLDSMCCVTCGGIGGCGSSVSGSCGNCST